MVESIPRQTLIIIAAAVLFLAFMGVRLVVDAGQREATPPQEYYDELTAALLEAGLLPTGSPDNVVINAARVTSPEEGFGEQHDLGSGEQLIILGPAMHLKTRNSQAYELKVNLNQWGKVSSIRLRNAMRELNRLDLPRQRPGSSAVPMGNNAPSVANFYFTGYAESKNYRFTPYFKVNTCTSVMVRRE